MKGAPSVSAEAKDSAPPVLVDSILRLSFRAVAAIFALALAARLCVAAAGGLSTPRFGDWPAYVEAAKTLLRTGHFPFSTTEIFFRPPGYAFFLAVATLGHPDSIACDKVAGAAAGALAAPFLAMLSARIFRRRGLALATGIAAALHPAFVYITSDVQTETVFLPLLLSAGYFLLASTDRPSANLALCAGLLLAGAALTRPSALAMAPLLGAPLLDRRWPARARVHIAAAAALGMVLGLAPWTARNYLLFHELIPVSDEGGASFFDGNSRLGSTLYELTDRRQAEPLFVALHLEKKRHLEALGGDILSSPSRRSLALVRIALEDRRADPAGTARLLRRKLWHWIRPYPTLFWGKRIVLVTGALYTLLYVFTAVGFARAQRRGVVSFAAAVLAISMAVHVALLVLWRYRIPYADPILLLWGLFGASDTLFPLWTRRS
ncbi:MAG: glycosyltransferase family 39 protein [Thermoanaerobaculia bacterium]